MMSTGFFRNIFFATALIGSIASCNKKPTAPPAWWNLHGHFYYDLTTDTSYITNYRQLIVGSGSSADQLFFYELPTDTSLNSWESIFEIFGNGTLKVKEDGLYSHASDYCKVGVIDFTFDFLFMPAQPAIGESIPQYGCEHQNAGYNTVVLPDTILSVPAGTYHTFCVKHPNGDRSYWNTNTGIIMYEQWQHDPSLPPRKLQTLTLCRQD